MLSRAHREAIEWLRQLGARPKRSGKAGARKKRRLKPRRRLMESRDAWMRRLRKAARYSERDETEIFLWWRDRFEREDVTPPVLFCGYEKRPRFDDRRRRPVHWSETEWGDGTGLGHKALREWEDGD